MQEIKKQIISITKIVLVLITVVIIVAVIIVGIALYCSLQKKVPYSEVGYQKLLANDDNNLENDDRTLPTEGYDFVANGNILGTENGEV